MNEPLEAGREFINRLYPHLNSNEDKFNYIIYSLKNLIKVINGDVVVDDQDSPANHELYTEVQLFALCIREKLEEIKKVLTSKILKYLKKERDNLHASGNDESSTTNNSTTITTATLNDYILVSDIKKEQHNAIKEIFKKTDWSIGSKLDKLMKTGDITTMSCSDIMQTTGFSIVAERINYWRYASHFQSVSRGSFFTNLKVTTVRKLRPEAWGFFCPINTPDGTPCGLLNHLTVGCNVSSTKNTLNTSIFYELGLNPSVDFSKTCLFYNGRIMGSVDETSTFVYSLRRYRMLNDLKVEIIYESKENLASVIYVVDSVSMLLRQVINVKENKKEWIGIREQLFLDIETANFESNDVYYDINKFPYKEIDNLKMFSSLAGCISFGDHNPSPRNMYQCQMAKQTMGFYAYNSHIRTDNKAYQINYLQQPIVHTYNNETFEPYPLGYNCVVAVLSYTAYDMEDAVILNKASVDRGMFKGYVISSQKINLEKHSQIIKVSDVGDVIKENDIVLKYEYDGVELFKRYDHSDTGVVEKVLIYDNGSPSITIIYRHLRVPTIGDKFCSRHGQKGVCSVLWPEENMPFTKKGTRPDIIINPHAFPSRMTIGMLLESMVGKVGAQDGKFIDSTIFTKNSYFDLNQEVTDFNKFIKDSSKTNIGKELKDLGFNYFGNEPMYSGVFGTEFRTDIFIGVVYYQRLKHMVGDKYQVRTSWSNNSNN